MTSTWVPSPSRTRGAPGMAESYRCTPSIDVRPPSMGSTVPVM